MTPLAEYTRPSPDAAAEAAEAARSLAPLLGRKKGKSQHVTVVADGEREARVVVPRAAFELFVRILGEMANGNAVTIVPVHAELTTQQASSRTTRNERRSSTSSPRKPSASGSTTDVAFVVYDACVLYPASVRDLLIIESQHPDAFVLHLLSLDAGAVAQAVAAQAASLRNPPATRKQLLETLESRGLVQSGAELRKLG